MGETEAETEVVATANATAAMTGEAVGGDRGWDEKMKLEESNGRSEDDYGGSDIGGQMDDGGKTLCGSLPLQNTTEAMKFDKNRWTQETYSRVEQILYEVRDCSRYHSFCIYIHGILFLVWYSPQFFLLSFSLSLFQSRTLSLPVSASLSASLSLPLPLSLSLSLSLPLYLLFSLCLYFSVDVTVAHAVSRNGRHPSEIVLRFVQFIVALHDFWNNNQVPCWNLCRLCSW